MKEFIIKQIKKSLKKWPLIKFMTFSQKLYSLKWRNKQLMKSTNVLGRIINKKALALAKLKGMTHF